MFTAGPVLLLAGLDSPVTLGQTVQCVAGLAGTKDEMQVTGIKSPNLSQPGVMMINLVLTETFPNPITRGGIHFITT